jgi:drug/metabolite transporter (DMT)-like permease
MVTSMRDHAPAAVPTAALVTVAVVWGVSFSVVDGAVDQLPAADLVAWRFGLATAVLALFARTTPALPVGLRARSVALGALLGAGFLLQTWAITDTDALMSGFLTGTLVVLAPLIGLIVFRDRLNPLTWFAVAIATVGVALLCLRWTGFGPGEALTLLAALAWALHLVLLSRWARADQAVAIARVQTGTVAVMALAAVGARGLVTGRSALPALPHSNETWLAVAFLAVVATAGAMLLITWAQARVSAVRAAIVLTLEPAAAAVTAALLGSELGVRTVLGGVLLLGAMLLIEIGNQRGRGRHRARPRRSPLVDADPYSTVGRGEVDVRQ